MAVLSSLKKTGHDQFKRYVIADLSRFRASQSESRCFPNAQPVCTCDAVTAVVASSVYHSEFDNRSLRSFDTSNPSSILHGRKTQSPTTARLRTTQHNSILCPTVSRDMFPPLHTYLPTAGHTHTVVFLHGRGSNGPEFAADLFAGHNLPAEFPTVRWVFPTASTQHSTVFQEPMTEWFDIYSLSDPDFRGDLQLPGLRNAVTYISGVVEDEIRSLDGKSERIVLAGISQGMATALWILLAGRRRLGGFLGVSGWFPFAGEADKSSEPGTIVRDMIGLGEGIGGGEGDIEGFLQMPAWLGHGEDDAYVDVELGKRARGILETVGMRVEWKTYTGAEEEGHWFKEPEEFDDIVAFLRGIIRV